MTQSALLARIAALSRSALTGKHSEEAERLCRLGQILSPGEAVFSHHLGLIEAERANPGEAIHHLRSALALYGDSRDFPAREAARDLARMLLHHRPADEALATTDGLLARWPRDAVLLRMGARAAVLTGDWDKAAERFKRLLAATPGSDPDRGELAAALGRAELAAGRPGAAAEALRKAAELVPHDPAIRCDLATTLARIGRNDEAAAALEAAVDLDPADVATASELLRLLPALPGQSPPSLVAACRRWGRLFYRKSPAVPIAPAGNRLRLGLMVADARGIAAKLGPWLPFAREAGLEPVVYAPAGSPLASHARWRVIAGQDDETVARTVARDRLQVLVDIDGHGRACRLGVLARRPAAVQAAWLNPTGTTGLVQVDGVITDRSHAGPLVESAFVEAIWHLPATEICAAADPDDPAPEGAAFRRTGEITFAAFHPPALVGPALIAAWAKILAQVPDSRLLVAAPGWDERTVRDSLAWTLAAHGIKSERLTLVEAASRRERLEFLNLADFALDSFPRSNRTAAFDALAMGIPLVTVAGTLYAARHGAALLSAAGFAGEVATGGGYVARARAWAKDSAMLAADRTARREVFLRSPLADPRSFARDLARLLMEHAVP